jgi:SHS2 domain-containing protein
VEVEAHDEYALLYNWLERLLVKFDLTDNLYSRFKVFSIEETSSGLKLKAKIWGEPLDLAKHPRKVGVKAVTYHRMEILKKPKSVIVKFILDI